MQSSNQYGLSFTAPRVRTTWSSSIVESVVGYFLGGGPAVSVQTRSVVVSNRLGQTRVLEEVSPYLAEDAVQERLKEIEEELGAQSLSDWCAKYKVPMTFVDGSRDAVVVSEPQPPSESDGVEYDLHNWSAADILDALGQIKGNQIPYHWDDQTQVLTVPQGSERAANNVIFGSD